ADRPLLLPSSPHAAPRALPPLPTRRSSDLLSPPHTGEGDIERSHTERRKIERRKPHSFPSPLWGGVRGGGISAAAVLSVGVCNQIGRASCRERGYDGAVHGYVIQYRSETRQ